MLSSTAHYCFINIAFYIEIAVHFAINFAKMNEFDEVADECFLILLDYLTCTYLPYENN